MPRLAELLRAKFPGAYDDMDDGALEQAVRAMYPGVYDDLAEPQTNEERAMGLFDDPGPFGQLVRGAQGGGLMSVGPQAIDAGRRAIGGLARRMYQGALKPSKALAKKPGERALIDTGLEEGITVSRRGLRKAEDTIDTLDDAVTQQIAGSTATVPKASVMRRLADPVREFADQANPLTDLKRIAQVGREFKQTRPALIPIAQAQRIKQGTYRAQGKKYGQQGAAEVEAEKALARGLKEEISDAVPAVAPLNARQTQLIDLSQAVADAVRRTGNRDLVGLTDVMAAGSKPGLLAATLAMRAPVQSTGARLLHRTNQAVNAPDALAAAVRALILGSQE